MQEETRAKVVSGLWQYIKSNRLQDPEDRRYINLNSDLQQVLGNGDLERIEFHQIISLLKPHLHEPTPIEITLQVDRQVAEATRKFSLPITVQSQNLKAKLQFLVDHDYAFE